MELEDYGKYTNLVCKLKRRAGGARVSLEQVVGLLRHVVYDREALLYVLSLSSLMILRVSKPDEAAALRAELLAIGIQADDPVVADQVLHVIWRERWCGKASLTSAEFHFWLCDLSWEAGEWVSAHRLVGSRLEVLAKDVGMLPLLVDMYPTSLPALNVMIADAAIPGQHAVGVFMRHMREGEMSLEVGRWAWRGVVSEERERLLLMLCEQLNFEPRVGLIRMLWEECERAQERVLLLRLRDRAPRMGSWRELAHEALSSAYAPLHVEAVSVLRQYGGPPDVAALLEAAQGRSEEQQRAIQDAIRVMQRGADRQRFAGALSLQEDEGGGQGALSLAGGEAGGLSQVGTQDEGRLARVEPRAELVVASGISWMEAAPAPRKLSNGARLVLLARGADPRVSASLFALGVMPPLAFIVASLLGFDSSAGWGLHTGFQLYIMPFFFLVRTSLWSVFTRGAVVEGELGPGVFEARSGKQYKLKGMLARREASAGMAMVSQDRAYDLAQFAGVMVASDGGVVASKRAVALALLMLGLTNNAALGFALGALMCIPAIVLGL